MQPAAFGNIHFDYVLVKLAARCNIACTYCYWFKDESVYSKPKVMPLEVEEAFVNKLKNYLLTNKQDSFEVILHGGEPMLLGKKRIDALCNKLRALEKELKIELLISITTNGLLIDEEWASIFKKNNLNVGISIDGSKEIHDKRRIDFKGQGTYDKVVAAIKILNLNGITPGILAVTDADADPKDIYRSMVDELYIKQFDLLTPDATYADKPKSIYSFYKKLFDLWYDNYSKAGVFIPFLECLVRGILGQKSLSSSIGYTPVKTITILTDGAIEPLDYLRISGNEFTKTSLNVFNNEFQDLQQHTLWQEVYNASMNLHPKCNACKFKYACGGGPVQSRWDTNTRFNNPSVYCDDLYNLFEHVKTRVYQDIY